MMFVETATTPVNVAKTIITTATYLSLLDPKRGLSLDYNNSVNVRSGRLEDNAYYIILLLNYSNLAIQKISPNLQSFYQVAIRVYLGSYNSNSA